MKTQTVRVPLKGRPYQVHIGAGLLRRLPELMARHFKTRKAALVMDARLKAGLGRRAEASLKAAGWQLSPVLLPSGEKAKSLEAVGRLYGELLKAGVERSTPLIALGGGALGDAAGFAAATYYRGIPLVHVPTTLLAQVDSSVGGKTAVDHPLAKNAVGAFHQPAFVLSDAEALEGLPPRQLLSGLAEVVKIALVFDPSFARWLELHWDELLAKKSGALIRAVAASVRWKAEAVGADEYDRSGRRELLNFGHTLGHALEAASRYRFLHGEAVAWGMRAAVELSERRGGLSGQERGLAASLLKRLPAPAAPRGLKRQAVLDGLKSDKKIQSGRNVFVLLKGLGRPYRSDDVSLKEIESAARRIGLPAWAAS